MRRLDFTRVELNAVLSQWNCETVVEHTGVDAIHRAATFRPDVALLGDVMPGMGSVEAAIKLLEICPGTKIVLITESVPPETVKRLAVLGYLIETLPSASLLVRNCGWMGEKSPNKLVSQRYGRK